MDQISDEEYTCTVQETAGGRKKRQSRKESKIYEPSCLNIECTHLKKLTLNPKNKGLKKCNAKKFTMEDLEYFVHHLTQHKKKIEQDKFLLKYMDVHFPKKRVRKDINTSNMPKPRSVAINYYFRLKIGDRVPVCAQFFRNATGVSSNRLATIARYFIHTGNQPEERRGGNRSGEETKNITEAIKEHIRSYKCRESHYSRKKIKRSYLPPTLNIQKMYEHFNQNRKENNLKSCSLSKYKRIFYNYFNLGFGNPHSDTCSRCKILRTQIKCNKSIEERGNLRTQLKLHKLRAKKFHQLMNKHITNEINIVFDIQQNQPLPKLSIGEVFYSRQVWLYNLTIMVHSSKSQTNKENISHYVWLETEAARGANEVASCIIHYLRSLESKMGKRQHKYAINLFSDSCASQNKNSILMSVLMYFLKQSKLFTTITHYFPIRGHSYMPADRIFGQIEKKYRRIEEILSPQKYMKILEETGIVLRYGTDWEVLDYKKQSKSLLKSKMPFKISELRVIQYSKINNQVQISVSSNFCGCLITCDVLKKGKSIELMKSVEIVPKTNMVSEKKMEDVKKLMEFFVFPNDAKEFYEDILKANMS